MRLFGALDHTLTNRAISQFYTRHAEELANICDVVRDSFKDYRRTVKRLLLL